MREYFQYVIAHHPLCNHYGDHVYSIRGRKICRGCTCQYSGIVSGLVITLVGNYYSWWLTVTDFILGLILYAMIAPTVFFSLFNIKYHWIKDISRFMLGIAITWSFILFILTTSNLIRLWILINFLPGTVFFCYLRDKRNSEICMKCEEYSTKPYCSGLEAYVTAGDVKYDEETTEKMNVPIPLNLQQLKE
ncbi:MAG: hypothetical protein ACFFD4_35905 [Candidatus Odinarchaeota archaeon]